MSRAELMKRLSSRRLLDGAIEQSQESASDMNAMMERHAMEIARLENELRSEEISKINEVCMEKLQLNIAFNQICASHLPPY